MIPSPLHPRNFTNGYQALAMKIWKEPPFPNYLCLYPYFFAPKKMIFFVRQVLKKTWQGKSAWHMHRRFLDPQKVAPVGGRKLRKSGTSFLAFIDSDHKRITESRRKRRLWFLGRKSLWKFTDDMPTCMNKNQELLNFGWWFDFKDSSPSLTSNLWDESI